MKPASPRSISLAVCIDDFGMHAGVNDAALELGRAGRVTAISCMVHGPAWRAGAQDAQRELRGKVDLGLHLDFTEQWPGSTRHTLPALILSAYAGRLSSKETSDEVRRQFDAYEDASGARPDFVDGHQHVHQLPTIREALVAELRRRYPGQRPWIRNCAPPGRFELKPHIIDMLGGAALRQLADQGGFPQNQHLLGVYGFAGTASAYRQRMGRWLSEAVDRDLLMCHPASGGADELVRARRIEYEFLRGGDFIDMLQQSGVTLARLSDQVQGSTLYRS
jgi:predicted glycoside hydrolase/deacetylase ChbG (UPF0249 family)